MSSIVPFRTCKLSDYNHLKLNDSKTEATVIGTHSSIKQLNTGSSIQIGNDSVEISKSVKNRGAILTLSTDQHISSVTKTCYFQLFHVSKIRPYLTEAAVVQLVCSFVLSRIDYAYFIFLGLPDMLLNYRQFKTMLHVQ